MKSNRSKKSPIGGTIFIIAYIAFILIMIGIRIYDEGYWKGRKEEFYECTDKHKDDYKRGLEDGEKIWRH